MLKGPGGYVGACASTQLSPLISLKGEHWSAAECV